MRNVMEHAEARMDAMNLFLNPEILEIKILLEGLNCFI